MADETLVVPAQLDAQLAKCKSVRSADYYKPRTKTAAEIAASKAKLAAASEK